MSNQTTPEAEILFRSGATVTAAAQSWCRDRILAAPQNPAQDIYLMSYFTALNLRLHFAISSDGLVWSSLGDFYTSTLNPTRTVRDPSWLHRNGLWYVAYSEVTGGPGFSSDYFRVVTSKDGFTWSSIATPTISGATQVWSPEFFTDDDGSLHLLCSSSASGVSGPHRIFLTSATSADLTGWSTPVEIFNTVNAIDPFIVRDGGVYHLFYKNETSAYIEVATATSLAGPYTVVQSGNWAGWGTPVEGPSIVRDPATGRWTIWIDRYIAQKVATSESATTSLLGSWSALTDASFPQTTAVPRHGTVRRLTADSLAGISEITASLTPQISTVAKGGGGVTVRGRVIPADLAVVVNGFFAQIQLVHQNGSGTHNAATFVVANDSLQLFKGPTATVGTFLADITMGTGALDWYGSANLRGGLKVGPTTTGTLVTRWKHGTATLVAGTVAVADTTITANSRIFVNRFTDVGTVGSSYSVTRNAGVGFTITSKEAGVTQTLDTSVMTYQIIEP